MKNKIEKSEKTICFSREKILPCQNKEQNFDFSGETAVKIAASERHWRLPSSPIVEKKLWFPYVNSNVILPAVFRLQRENEE